MLNYGISYINLCFLICSEFRSFILYKFHLNFNFQLIGLNMLKLNNETLKVDVIVHLKITNA